MRYPQSNEPLQQLQEKNLLWRAGENKAKSVRVHASGYEELDQALQGGWPESGAVELQVARYGLGELRLILPVIQALATRRAFQVWLGVPAQLNAQSLPPEVVARSVLLSPAEEKQGYWVLEQVLTSACCSVVTAWLPGLNTAQAKRLQILAKDSSTLLFLIVAGVKAEQSLPLSLRLSLHASSNGLEVHVLKRQNAWPIAPFEVDFRARWPQLFPQKSVQLTALPPDNVVHFPTPTTLKPAQ